MLEFRDIRKSFFGVPVLKGVSFTVGAGRTVGLVGENGAGKSTLMNILGGNHRPDDGLLLLAGGEFEPRGPRDAEAAGVAFIHQELNLFPNLSVAENLFLTAFPHRAGTPLIDTTQMRERTRALLAEVDVTVSPDTLVEHLPTGERQLVEIAKALSLDARLIILDEPTTSLTARETERLFALMTRLRARGIAMIYISHVLEDVLRLCDDIVVLRDGERVATGPRAEFIKERMVTLMVGRNIQQFFPPRTTAPGAEPLLEAVGLTQPGVLRDIHFTLRRGEVLGVAGLMGSGRSELARVLFGLDPCERGEVRVTGRVLDRRSPRACIRERIAFLTEDRRAEGLCMEASIAANLALVTLPEQASLGWLDLDGLRARTAGIRDAVRLNKSARDAQPVKSLSGGNQQKVVLAKWLLAEPSVFILDEPTRGIDIGAKTEIYALINDLVARGAGVLVISSEIEELIGICDRILVMNRGELTDEIARPDFDRERILRAALQQPRTDAPVRSRSAARTGASALLGNAPLVLFAIVLALFGVLAPQFFTAQNLTNIAVQASSTAIVAIGMTFVLLTAGVDLSVGAIMFIGAAVAGKMVLAGQPFALALAAMLGIGAACGAVNALLITRLGVMPFVVTLATLYVGRGFALWVTQTRAMNLPESFLQLGAVKLAGIPLPIVLFAAVLLLAHLTLTCTTFGRHIYAVGADPDAALKAGLNSRRILLGVYLVCGVCAALGGIISLAQIGAVSPKFGENREFTAIAAAVLGGASLFGGRGRVFPGTVIGALLIQSVENGLVILNADPYLYPLITSAIIFLAVLLDSLRNHMVARLGQRQIRVETA